VDRNDAGAGGIHARRRNEERKRFQTAWGIYHVSYETKGYWFRTPEAWDITGNYRASMYMRPASIWFNGDDAAAEESCGGARGSSYRFIRGSWGAVNLPRRASRAQPPSGTSRPMRKLPAITRNDADQRRHCGSAARSEPRTLCRQLSVRVRQTTSTARRCKIGYKLCQTQARKKCPGEERDRRMRAEEK